MRRALRAYGITPESESDKSGYDVIKHLLGRNSGAATDLSTNPEYFKDYGR